MGRSGIEKAPDELYESVADIAGQVGLRVVQLDPLPGGKRKLGEPGRREAAELTVPNARQREPARPVWLECCLDRADHVVARVLPVQAQVVAENRTAVDVDHHQQPDSLDLELLLEAERVTDDDLQPNVEAVPIELDDFKGFSAAAAAFSSRGIPLTCFAPARWAAR